MYLILDKETARERNLKAANDLKWKHGLRWAEIELTDGNIALDVRDGEGLNDDELVNCTISIAGKILGNELNPFGLSSPKMGSYYRRTDKVDENGNYYLEHAEEVTLSDGTVIAASDHIQYDGVEGWHWYADGDDIKIATPTLWEKIKNWF